MQDAFKWKFRCELSVQHFFLSGWQWCVFMHCIANTMDVMYICRIFIHCCLEHFAYKNDMHFVRSCCATDHFGCTRHYIWGIWITFIIDSHLCAIKRSYSNGKTFLLSYHDWCTPHTYTHKKKSTVHRMNCIFLLGVKNPIPFYTLQLFAALFFSCCQIFFGTNY